MNKIVGGLIAVAAMVGLAVYAKPRLINAADFLVRQPLLEISQQLAAASDVGEKWRSDIAPLRQEASRTPTAPTPPEPAPIKSSWKLVRAEAPFPARDGAFVASFKGYIWLTNGYNPQDIPNPIYRSKDGFHWEVALASAPWPRRHLGGFVVLNDRLFMIAGDFQTDVWSSADGIEWVREPDVPWGKRYNPYIGVYDGKIWMMGGQTFDGPTGEWCEKPYCLSHAWNDVWSTEDGKTWRLVTERAAWEPRALISGFAVHDGAMWVMGGGIREVVPFNPTGPLAETRIDYADVWRSTDGKTWENVTFKAEWPARSHQSVAGYDGFLIVNDGSTGIQGNLQSDTWASRDGKNWTKIGDSGQIPARHASRLVEHNGDLFLIAGLLHNDVWKLDPSALAAKKP